MRPRHADATNRAMKLRPSRIGTLKARRRPASVEMPAFVGIPVLRNNYARPNRADLHVLDGADGNCRQCTFSLSASSRGAAYCRSLQLQAVGTSSSFHEWSSSSWSA